MGKQFMEQELKRIVVELLGIEEYRITDDLSIDNTDTWDSLKHMELMVSIEERFEISLTTDEIVTMTSFAEIKSVLRKKEIEV